MATNIHTKEYKFFIADKTSYFDKVIISTIKSLQKKKDMNILSPNDIKLATNDLHNIKLSLFKSQTIAELQTINDNLSLVFKQYGSNSLNDLITICHGNLKIHACDNEKMVLLNDHFIPIKYDILTKNDIRKNKKKDIENIDCGDLLESKCMNLQVYGITISIYHETEKKYIFVTGIIDNLSAFIITNDFISNKLVKFKNTYLKEYNEKKQFRLFYNSLLLKDLIVYSETELFNTYSNIIKKALEFGNMTIYKAIHEYMLGSIYNQRHITISLLIENSQPSQYLAYLLYDLLTAEHSKNIDSKRQNSIYDTLPHELKQIFKNAIINTLTYIDSISNIDENKLPIEQQICLLKANDTVKEKAMQKLKEIKSKSEDSGSKSRQYLDGLLKIPFGIYKTNGILNIHKDIKLVFQELHNHMIHYYNFESLINDPLNILLCEIPEVLFLYNTHLMNMIDNKMLSKPEIHKINKMLLNSDISLKNNKKTSIINYIQNNSDAKKYVYETNEHIFQDEKEIIKQVYSKYETIKNSFTEIHENLDSAIHGHKTAKRQIERIVGQWVNGENAGYCLGFEGPPGIGKTSLAKKGIANCLKDENNESRPFAFIALGGSSNACTIDGHNYTYVGSTWGKIVDILMDTKCMNPIIFIDELDKVSKSDQGKEIIGVLTHLTDYSQNDAFQDKYFTGINLDLSKILFIFSYNDVNAIDKILLDRIHRIKFDIIDITDKITITQKYILPDLFKKMGLYNKIIFTDEVIKYIIETYTNEPGVRKLKEILFEITGEINLKALKNETTYVFPKIICPFEIDNIYMKNKRKIERTLIHTKPTIAMINGLWANSTGQGGILPIQASFFPASNKHELKLTGSQGDVMKESMNVANTLAYKLFGEFEDKPVNIDDYQAIHIHCPDGATPKDGPSAGTAITLVIYSLLSNKKIKNDIAITGEINLIGDILEIGGLDLKIIGGYKSGVKTIIFPKSNEKDFKLLLEKHNYLQEKMNFYPVEHIKDIIKLAFE
jgi:ATP-dependent Lon protease